MLVKFLVALPIGAVVGGYLTRTRSAGGITAVGMAILEKGGNAFDAAVAIGFMLQVAEPHLCGPGGEALDGPSRVVEFRGIDAHVAHRANALHHHRVAIEHRNDAPRLDGRGDIPCATDKRECGNHGSTCDNPCSGAPPSNPPLG